MRISLLFNEAAVRAPRLIIAIFAAIVCITGNAWGQAVGDYRSNGNGNWGTVGTWQRWNGASWGAPGAQGYPGQNAVPGTVTIQNNHTVTLNVSPANNIGTLVIAGGNRPSGVTFSGTNSLTVNGAITVAAGTGANDHKTVDVAGGTLTCASITLAPTGGNGNTRILISTGTATVTGSLTVSDATSAITFSGAGTLNIGNAFSSGATFTPSTGTVVYDGGNQSCGVYTYNNLTLTGSNTKTFLTSPTVNGTLSLEGTANVAVTTGVVTYGASATLQYNKPAAYTTTDEEWVTPFTGSGGVIIANTGAITLNGSKQLGNNNNAPLNINTGATLSTSASNFTLTFHGDFINDGTFTAGSSPIVIAGTTATQSIDGFSTTGLMSMTKTGGTATLTDNVDAGALTINGAGGTLNLGAGLTHNFTGAWTRTAGTLNGGSSTFRIGGSVSGAGGTFTAGTGTVEWYALGAQTLAGVTYNNLILSGSGVKTTTGVTVNGILSMEGTATASAVITYGAAATLRYNTATSRTVSSNEWPATFSGTGGVIIANSGVITLNGAKQLGNSTNTPLNINGGATLSTSPSNFGLTFHGNFINSGTFNAGGSAIVLDGTSATQSIAGFTTTGTVSMTKTGGTATFTGNVNGGALIINGAGGTLNLGVGLTHVFTGDWTRTAGTLNGGSSALTIGGTTSGSGGTFTASTGTVEWNANGAQTIADVNYNNLVLSGSGTKVLQSGTTAINGNLTLSGTAATTAVGGLTIGGSVDLGTGTSFTSGAFTHNIAGDWTNNGSTVNNAGSTINLNGANQNISGSSTTFNNLTLAGSNTKTFNAATFITNDLTIGTGVVANLSTFTNHTANTLHFSTTGQNSGTWGSTASTASNQNNTFFAAAGTGILTVAVRSSAIYYSRQNGNWNANATWSTITYGNATNNGTFPVAGDVVNIGGGDFTITVNVNSACSSLSYQGSTGNSPTVSISPGITLNVSGAIDLVGAGNADDNTLAVGAGTLNAASLAFTTGSIIGGHRLTISTGTATINGAVTGGSLLSPAVITFTGAGTLNIGGDCDLNSLVSTFTPSTGTVHYFGTGAQTIPDFNYYNLTFSGAGNKTPIAAMNIDGNFTLAAGTSFTAGGYTHTLAGNWINNGASFNSSNSTISFDGAAQNIGGTTPTSFNNVTLAGTNTKTLAVSTTIDGLLTINTGVVANLSSITTHTSRALTLGTTGQGPGTWGSTASAATNKNDTFFTAASTGILTVTGRAFYSRANGAWTTAATWSNNTYGGTAGTLTPGAADVVNIGGGDYAITVGADAFCAALSYQGNTTDSPTLTINAGTLTVSGAVNIPSGTFVLFDGVGTNTLAVGAGSLVAGSMEFSTGGLFGGHALTIGSGTVTINGDVTQGFPNADITFTGNGNLILKGAFLNSTSCDFTRGTGTVQYASTSVAQTIGDFTYYNLTLNNTSGAAQPLTLFDDAVVASALTMTSGNVNLNGSTLTIGTAGTSVATIGSLNYTAGWMYGGTLRRYFTAGTAVTLGTNEGLFPLGTSTDYRPLYLGKTNQANTDGALNVTHNGNDNSTSVVNFADDNGQVTRRHNSFWTVSKQTGMAGTGNPYSIRAGGTGFGTIQEVDDLRLVQAGSEVGNTSLPNGGNTASPLVNKVSISNGNLAQNYYIGSVDATNTPLPVELLNFTAELDNDIVLLDWSTASELNNDYFSIEKATNLENFEEIEIVKGSGTSNNRHDYHTFDPDPAYGRSYYRLKQTDYDGRSSYSAVRVVDYEGPRFATLKAYPNPSNGRTLTVAVVGLKEQTSVPIQIFNVQGQLIYQRVLQVDVPGILRQDVEFESKLAPGLYIIKAGQTQELTKKIAVE